ncbi:Cyclic nucleotide-gated olfactory channel [Phytophthora citrophthora]|uniref:Cyclic nucleotide-gated olfactory channel n=1 Tax=Phytophthora citrophthora TaxID=4793 RepID=A0AAD9G152_9STRA|nr:Cyclic nucleotide-gated olfactory channel [Phytophthora citrophthora]
MTQRLSDSHRVDAVVSRRSSLHSAIDRLRRSTTFSSAPLRTSLTRPRSNSVELLLFEVQNAFDPNSTFIHMWQQLLLVCVIYEITILPFIVVFRDSDIAQDTAELVIVYICELFFLADVYVELNTGFYEGGDVTRDAKKSRVRYVKSPRFVLDIAALVPVSLFPVETAVSLAFYEMHKFLRIWRIPKYIARLDDVYARYFVVLKMFKVLVGILLLSHFLACARFLFGYDEHGDDHWLPHKPHHEQSSQTKYLMSIYWSFGVMTGLFEGELPHSIAEFIFTMFVAICGFLLFTYLCAMFFMISKCESGQNEASEARINQFKHLLSFHQVPEELQQQAIGYLKRYYTYTESNDREAMRLLCPSIRKDIQVALMKDSVAKVVIFEGCNDQFIVAITSLLEMISLPAYFVVFNSGDKGDAMYFVNSGVLHVIVNGVKVREQRKGDFFGEMSVFLNRPRFATVKTTTYCTLYKLARFHLERVLDGYPEYLKLIPKQVEDMARRMFSGESRDSDSKLATTGKKKTISRLLRKAVQSEKMKPSLGWVIANAVAKKDIVVPAVASETSNSAAPTKSPSPQASNLPDPTNPVPPLVSESKAPQIPDENRSQTPVANAPALADKGVDQSGDEQILKSVVILRSPEAEGSLRKSSLRMMQMVATQINFKRDPKAPVWTAILLRKAIDFESRRRMWWILALEINFVYFWFVIPTRLVFEVLDYESWLLSVLNVLMELELWIDIYLNFNLSFIENAEKIWDTASTAQRYLRSGFVFDLFCALPHWAMGSEFLSLLRLLRIWRVKDHVNEVDEFLHLNNRRRLMLFGWLMVMLYHTFACLYFSVTYIEGFSTGAHAWLPSSDLHLHRVNETYYADADNQTYAVGSPEIIEVGLNQYFRSLYYACYVITALGRPVEPASNTQLGAALGFMLIGFFITAIVVDNVQKRFTASAFEQKEFFSNRTRIQLFLMRQNAPLAIHKRVSAFLDFWWSAHRGAVIGSLLEDLPATIKVDIMKSVCKPALQTIALLAGVRPVLNELEQVFIENVKFILYGQGEVVYRQGDFAGGLFFLLEGELCVIANGRAPRSIPQGSFIGTAALDFDNSSPSYVERVMAISGCIVLFISREHLRLMRTTFTGLPDALEALEKRFLDPKFLKASEMTTTTAAMSNRPFIIAWLIELVFDPDSGIMIAWEAWVFFALTVQCLLTISMICFPVSEETDEKLEIITFLIEVFFLFDIFVRFRLGFHEFGNKVMDLRLIRKNYIRSRALVIDALALFPLYFIEWGMASTGHSHLEILNLNKLVRLMKVPTQLAALENKHLKYTLQLRLFKLVYYTFMLSHILGCFYFDFRSHSSHIHGDWDHGITHEEEHAAGEHWLADKSLLDEGFPLQYFTALFWSFGVMSASYPGELPKTTSQCVFNTITLTFGFFLFAYVVGNFSDIIELMDAENREYYATLSSFRHLLAHFNLPLSIQERFKAYFFFKRFHSITQEHLLESCLPPSLLTDIRMVHLKPMIVKVSFLSGMNGSVTRLLVSHFSQVMVVKDEFVYKYGEEGSDMYFVFAGLLDTLIPREEEIKQRALMSRRTSMVRRSPTENSLLARKPSIKPMSSSRKVHPRPQSEWTSDKLDVNELTKTNQVSAGDYFGENALFVDSVRNAFVLAKSTSILYKLSRNSLETVFNRYPEWKQKVIRVINLQQQQLRLTHIAKLERHNSIGSTMTEEDHMNAYAEKLEEVVISARYKRSSAASAISRRETLSRHTGPPSPVSLKDKPKGGRFQCTIPTFVSVLFRGAPAQSSYHLTWIRVVIFATLFMSTVVPYRISFDSMEHTEWLPVVVREIEILCEALYVTDIWVNWRIQRSSESVDLYEQDHREAYKSERLVYDILAAIPVDYFFSSFSTNPLYRINRCLKLRNFLHYMDEINRRSIHKELHRLRTASILYVMIMYWSACAYFAIAVYDHFGDEWNAWLPDVSLSDPDGKRTLRLLRGCFFATTSFIKKGRTFQPDTIFHFVFCIIVCFVGLLTMAFMIGEIANLFISYISNEVEYRKNHISVELYLGRWKITGELKARTQAFLSSLWSSHRGVDYQSFLEGVPACIRTDSILDIAQTPLRSFVNDIFRPLPNSEAMNITEKLMQDVARYLRFEGYPRGENVLVEGSITKAMYFVVRGYLFSTSESQPNRSNSFSKGTYFGEKGLLVCSVSTSTIQTLRACDLLSLSPDSLLRVLQNHRVTKLAYEIAAQAVEVLKAKDRVASGVSATESEWGEAVLGAIRFKQAEVNQSSPEDAQLADGVEDEFSAAVRTRKHLLELLDKFLLLNRAIDAFGAFRPLLQLLVPNGQLQNFRGAKADFPASDMKSAPSESEPASKVTDDQKVHALAIIGRLFNKNNTVIPAINNKSMGSKQEVSPPSKAVDNSVQHELSRLIPSPTMKSIDNRSVHRSFGSARLPPLEVQSSALAVHETQQKTL